MSEFVESVQENLDEMKSSITEIRHKFGKIKIELMTDPNANIQDKIQEMETELNLLKEKAQQVSNRLEQHK